MNEIVTKTIRFIFVMYLRVVLNTRYIVYYSIWDVQHAVGNIDIETTMLCVYHNFFTESLFSGLNHQHQTTTQLNLDSREQSQNKK